MAKTVARGVFYAVGVGPGDPELLTLKAARILRQCPVIAAPVTHSGEMLALDIAKAAVDLAGKEILPLHFTMAADRAVQHKAHLAAAAAVCAVLDGGRDVAMLNLGDVAIYATAGYILDILRAQGYQTQMIPGVPSFCAVAARLGQSLTGEAGAPLQIIPAGNAQAVQTALQLPGAAVIMKAGSQLPAVAAQLQQAGLLQHTALVSRCGLEGEQVWPSLAQGLPPQPTGYFATLVVQKGPKEDN